MSSAPLVFAYAILTHLAHSTVVQAGPPGGYIRAVVIDPKSPVVVYAATSCGLFKTIDGGASWRSSLDTGCPPFWPETSFSASGPFGPAEASATGRALALDPVHPSIIYAGRSKSEDGGATWKEILAPARLPNDLGPNSSAAPTAWAIDPTNTSTIYAGFAMGRGLVKSKDAGITFTEINSGLPVYVPGPDQTRTMGDIVSIVVDPSNPATLYVAANRRGVYKSTDAGSTWFPAHTGLTSDIVVALVHHPANTSTLYAAASGEDGGGVFETRDGGSNWQRVGASITGHVLVSLAIAPSDPGVLYAGTTGGEIYRSTDAGATWAMVGSGLPKSGVAAIAVDPVDASALYVGTYGAGIFRTAVGGGTWRHAGRGLPVAVVSALTMRSSDSHLLVATLGAGVFESPAPGEWRSIADGLGSAYVRSIAVQRSTSPTLYAGTVAGIYKSSDLGASWLPSSSGIPQRHYLLSNDIREVLPDPSNPMNVYAVTAHTGPYRSADGGANWHPMDLPHRIGTIDRPPVYALAADPFNPGLVYAGFDSFYRSEDYGRTWSRVDPEALGHDARPLAFAFDPAGTLYAVLGMGCLEGWWAECAYLYASADGGRNWRRMGDKSVAADISSYWKLAIDSRSGTIYCSGASHGLFRSNDNGITWTALHERLPATTYLPIALDANIAGRIYAGTTAGVYVSDDSGTTWRSKD